MPENYVISEKPEKDERRQIRGIYDRSGIALLVFLLLFLFIAGSVTYLLVESFFTPGTESYVNSAYVIGLSITFLLELGMILFGSKLTGIKLRSLFNTGGFTGKTIAKTYFTAQGLGYLGTVVGGIIIAIVTTFFGMDSTDMTSGIEQALAQSDFSMAFILIQSVLFAPILEELIFRGIILGSLSKYDRTLAIIISSVMFGVTHGNFQQAVYATVMGLVLGAVALRYNSIIPSVICHTLINAYGAVTALIMSFSGYLDVMTDIVNITNPLEVLELITPQMIISFMIVMFLNFGMVIAAAVILILNRKRFREFFGKASVAQKARSLPILITSIPWDINFAVAIFVVFVNPFLGLI
jgi:membrane protease YdiL (CAAX protease family)